MKKIFLFVVAALVWVSGYGLTAEEAFKSAPSSVFPLININDRLDMIDYFQAGMAEAGPTNALRGKSALTSMDEASIGIRMSDASDVQLNILPAGRDSVIMVITTVKTPSPDSTVAFYSSTWERLDDSRYYVAPTLTEWMTDRNHLDKIEAIVPFMLSSLTYDPATSQLTATNSLPQFLSEEVYAMIDPWMSRQLTYVWNGRKFVKR